MQTDKFSRLLSQTNTPVAPVAIDAMGGDLAPKSIVTGAIDAARLDLIPVILVGDAAHLFELVEQLGAFDLLKNHTISIVHASLAIAMDEKPSSAVRKHDSSMRVACDLVARGDACGALSAGNSGAMMAIALLRVGRIDGVIRPAIATLMPSTKGFSIVADVGANVDCTAQMLLQFAEFGSAFAAGVFGIDRPRIGVISNGEEDSKGTELTKAALQLIRASDLNAAGYCEGRDIFNGSIDVAVCDGFTGNVLLKTAEGTAHYITKSLRENVANAGIVAKIGAYMMSGVFEHFKKKIDPREYGAAPLLGLKAPVFIAHGNSDAYAIRRAISLVHKSHQGDVAQRIRSSLKKADYQNQ